MADKEETLIDVGHAYSTAENYIEQNKNSFSVIVAAIVLIVGGYFGYTKLYVGPMEEEAQGQMYVAERYFSMDSLNLALDGDGQYLGFIDIINEYGLTPSGNLANYYAGICFLKKGEFDQAIEYLKNFDGNDQIVAPVAIGAIGDACMELGKTEDALSYYINAAEMQNNSFSSPIFLMKAAMASEDLHDYARAAELYRRIKTEYANSKEGMEVDKFLSRAEAMITD